jgi:ubiquinone/menaquinone biosynthesis C-methylase UbiE
MPARFNFDRVADVYEETRRLPPPVLDGLAEQMASVFERGRVFDAGVGTGRYAEALAARGLAVVGLDVARKMLERARARGSDRLVQGELVHLPFRDGAFDHAIAIHILHLVADWRAMVRELGRVTRAYVASTRETRDPNIHRWYDEKVGLAHGAKAGIDAEDLADLVPPAVRFPRITYQERMAAEAYLDLLGTKTFTSQWDVPDDVHERAMRELRADLAGKAFESKRTWELLVWRVEDLRGL